MTLSIVARSADAACFGAAIASSSPAVAARCVQARSRVGAVASQNITDPALRDRMLEAMAQGSSADQAVRDTIAGTAHGPYRQLLAIGRTGAPRIHSGAQALGVVGSAIGPHCASAGNLLARAAIPSIVVEAFEQATGPLATRLLLALRAGVDAGGEAGPLRSAGLLVVRDLAWPIVDLRVDWSHDPVGDLQTAWTVFEPQVEDYVRRALDPLSAPHFGVPGDP